MKAIREKCKDCSETLKEIRECEFTDCRVYRYRMGYDTEPRKKRSTLAAIRGKCLDCCNGSRTEVDLCPVEGCGRWPYRFGVAFKDGVFTSKTPSFSGGFSPKKQTVADCPS
jgi:hypothetical protein